MNKLALITGIIFFSAPLLADFVKLKDGRFLNAKVNSTQGKTTTLLGADGNTFEIRSGDIDRLFVGMDPIPGCVRSDRDKKCGLIFQIRSNSIVMGQAEQTATEIVSLPGKGLILNKTDSPSQRISALLSPGADINLLSDGKRIKGVVKRVTGSRIELADGQSLSEKEIVRASSGKEFPIARVQYLIPGLSQYGDGKKTKGLLMMGVFSGLSILTYSEFRSQMKIRKAIESSYLHQYFAVQEKKKSFDHSRKREVLFAGLAAATYGFSVYDSFSAEMRSTGRQDLQLALTVRY